MTKHIAMDLTPDQEAYLSSLAERVETDLQGAVAELIREGIERQAWLEAIVEEGREDFRQGRTLSHEEVVANGRKLREELLRKHAE